MSVEMLMPKHVIDETDHSASLGSSAIHVACVSQLVGYTLAAVETQFIVQTLRHFQGNRTHAANALGISVRSLRDRIRVYRERGVFSLHVSEVSSMIDLRFENRNPAQFAKEARLVGGVSLREGDSTRWPHSRLRLSPSIPS